MSVRVRFAPSPTGSLHSGGARTALINYLFAKKHKGSFILRVEDTDLDRSSDVYLKQQLSDLKWLGFQWDEGVHPDTLQSYGDYGPYRQSQRLTLYKNYAEKLIESGKAYYCFLSDSETKRIKKEQGKISQVKSPYRDIRLEEARSRIARGEKPVVRFKNYESKKIYTLKDVVRGEVALPSDMVGDFILLRSSGRPVYNFSCVIDDHLMNISHVFRSEEHLANTLRQLMIYEAFEWPVPVFGHLSIILGEDRQKLSKRTGSVSCGEYRKQGYLPEAILNFLALLGWNPKAKQEVFLFSELVQSFSLEGLNAAPGVFDSKKLHWMNKQHIMNMDDMLLWERLQTFFSDENWVFPNTAVWRKRAIQTLKDSFFTFLEAKEVFRSLVENQFFIQDSAREVITWPLSASVLKAWEDFLNSHSDEEITSEVFSEICKEIQKKIQAKGKFLFMPIRSAVLGQASGTELKLIVPLIKRSLLLKRVRKLNQLLSGTSNT